MKTYKEIKESLFDDFGFTDADIKNTDKSKLPDRIKLGAKRGDVIKIKNTKWEVFKVEDDYHFSVYKHGTAKRKIYTLRNIGQDFEVYRIGGSGQRLNKQSEIIGKAKII